MATPTEKLALKRKFENAQGVAGHAEGERNALRQKFRKTGSSADRVVLRKAGSWLRSKQRRAGRE